MLKSGFECGGGGLTKWEVFEASSTLCENLYQSNPPITTMVRPKIRLKSNLRGDGDRVARTVSAGAVPVGGGVMDGLGDEVIVIGLEVCVAVVVAGGGHTDISRTACPYMGVFLKKQGRTNQERRNNEGRAKEDFSQNHPFCPLVTPKYGGCLLAR